MVLNKQTVKLHALQELNFKFVRQQRFCLCVALLLHFTPHLTSNVFSERFQEENRILPIAFVVLTFNFIYIRILFRN